MDAGLMRRTELIALWQEVCAAEQQCFGDSLTFETVRPILEKAARPLPEVARLKALRDDIAQHTASFFWNDVDVGLLHCRWRDELDALLPAAPGSTPCTCGSARPSSARFGPVYPPPFGREEDCICSDSWRKTRPRNHSEACERAYERKRAGSTPTQETNK